MSHYDQDRLNGLLQFTHLHTFHSVAGWYWHILGLCVSVCSIALVSL
jgi:hypothetical protein